MYIHILYIIIFFFIIIFIIIFIYYYRLSFHVSLFLYYTFIYKLSIPKFISISILFYIYIFTILFIMSHITTQTAPVTQTFQCYRYGSTP